MARPVTITPVAENVPCLAGEAAEHCFTVTNLSGARLALGVRALASDPAWAPWLSVVGKVERELSGGATDQVTVRLQPPVEGATGKCPARLLVYSTARPDEDFTEGPLVTFEVSGPTGAPVPPAPQGRLRWWWLAVPLLAVLIGGLVAWRLGAGHRAQVPALVGLPLERALGELRDAGLKAERQARETGERPADTVLEQSPAAGAKVDQGSLVTLVVARAPAPAPAPTTHVKLVGLAGKCLDVSGGNPASGTGVILWDCHGGANQRWSVAADGTIRGLAGKCLDVSGGNPASGTGVILWDCHGGANQRWSVNADGTVRGLAGKCLDVKGGNPASGTGIILWDCHGGANQRWRLQP
jgi:hypothetical protein